MKYSFGTYLLPSLKTRPMLRFYLNSIVVLCATSPVFAQHQSFPPEQKLFDGRVEIIVVGNKPCFFYAESASIQGKPSHFISLTIATNNRMAWDIGHVGRESASQPKPTSSSSCIVYGETRPQSKTTFPLNGVAKPLVSDTVYDAYIMTATLEMLSNYYSTFCVQVGQKGGLSLLQAELEESTGRLKCSKKPWK